MFGTTRVYVRWRCPIYWIPDYAWALRVRVESLELVPQRKWTESTLQNWFYIDWLKIGNMIGSQWALWTGDPKPFIIVLNIDLMRLISSYQKKSKIGNQIAEAEVLKYKKLCVLKNIEYFFVASAVEKYWTKENDRNLNGKQNYQQ